MFRPSRTGDMADLGMWACGDPTNIVRDKTRGWVVTTRLDATLAVKTRRKLDDSRDSDETERQVAGRCKLPLSKSREISVIAEEKSL